MATDMNGTLKLLIGGTPGAIMWSLLHLALLLPVWGLRDYFRDFRPGAGPQGGEAIFLLMVMLALAAIALAWIDAVLVLSTGGIPGWRRFALWPIALFLAPLLAAFLGFAMADAAGEADLTDTGRQRIAAGLAFILALYYGCCFGALMDVRWAGEAARTTP